MCISNCSKSIIITGCAGFIGSCMVRLLLKEYPECTVVGVDSLYEASNIHTMDDFKDDSRFRFYQADITDIETIDSIFKLEKPELVIHFAAETNVDKSLKNPNVFYSTNVEGTRSLLNASIKYGIKHFHQVSTDEVYGALPIDRPDLLFTEESPLHPNNPYSDSKAKADLLVLSYYKQYGLKVTISRSSNNYGPYQYPEKLIPLIVKKAQSDEFLPIYGDGLQVRDWLYVEDHCRGILAVIEKGRVGEVYNLGGHNERNNLYIVKRILSEMGKPESLITHVADRHGHDQRYAIDPHKANVELGWDPVTTFEEGIKKTIAWYMSDYGKQWLAECMASNEEWLKKNYENRK